MSVWAIAIHGGAGRKLVSPKDQFILKELHRIVLETSGLLRKGASALDAAEHATYLLEDSGLFNAGRGSCLTAQGTPELEAGICRGEDFATGSVLRVTDYAHPIRLARFILEHTDMVSMHGDRALELMAPRDRRDRRGLITPEKLALWRRLLKDADGEQSSLRKHHPQTHRQVLKSPQYLRQKKIGTVGAVARDSAGHFAAANSTGGFWLKLPGRIGDSPVFGAGYYASPVGAAVTTGVGELALRSHLCRSVVEQMEALPAQAAVEAAFQELERLFGSDNAGVIAVDGASRIGVWHNTPGMGHAFLTQRMKAPVVRAVVPGKQE